MKTQNKPTRVQLPHDRKSSYSRFGRCAALAALLALLAGPPDASAQSDNFNDGDDISPVLWDLVDSIFTASGGVSTPNVYDASTFQYHLTAAPSSDPGTLGPARTSALPPATPFTYTNFYVSVDVVAWDNTYVQPFGLLARGKEFGPGTTDGYLFGYANSGALLGPGNSYVTIIRMENEFSFNDIPGSGPGGDTLMKVDLDPTKDYRFVFIGRGTHLEGRVYELPNLITPVAVVSGNTAGDATILTSGQCGLLAYNAASATGTPFAGPVDVTFDNYYASSRCPMKITDMVVKDDFSDGNDTAPTVAWTRYDPIGSFVGFGQNTWSFPNGNSYRLQAPTQPFNAALGQGRVASTAPGVQTDFRIAVDIVDWDNAVVQNVGLLARLSNVALGTTTGYTFTYNVGGSGDMDVSRITGEAPTGLTLSGSDRMKMVPGNSYRFVFSGKGSELRALVFELPETMNPLVDCVATDTTYASGIPGLLGSANNDATIADVTFDNYSDTALAAPSVSLTVGSTPGGNVTISWPGNLDCIWVLESSPVLGAGAVWTEVPMVNTVYAAGQNVHTGPTPMSGTGNTFYRLKQL